MIRRILPVLFAVMLLQLSACGGHSPATTYYTLDSTPPSIEPPAGAGAVMATGLRQVQLPPVIKRPQLVLLEGENVKLLEFHRWSEPLDAAMLRILAAELRTRLGTESILAYPWPASFRPGQAVTLRVTRFNGLPGKTVELSGIWLIDQPGGAQPARIGSFRIIEPVADSSYAALVRAHSAALVRLADQLADTLTAK